MRFDMRLPTDLVLETLHQQSFFRGPMHLRLATDTSPNQSKYDKCVNSYSGLLLGSVVLQT